MDGLTLIGLLLGFSAILVGQMIEGGSLHSLLNPAALLIVLGGTVGAAMVQTPLKVFFRSFSILPWIFRPPKQNFERTKQSLVDMARKARQAGLLTLEGQIEFERNPLLRRGLELLVMGIDKTAIRDILEADAERTEEYNLHAAQFFEAMGGYSPTIGILGAVLGLIQVMRNLADPTQLGTGIAVAFVATIYGVGLANLLFLPVANKLKACVARQAQFDEMIIEGIASMASGESPNMLNLKLTNYGRVKLQHAPAKKEN